jgi:hypothetical protein
MYQVRCNLTSYKLVSPRQREQSQCYLQILRSSKLEEHVRTIRDGKAFEISRRVISESEGRDHTQFVEVQATAGFVTIQPDGNLQEIISGCVAKKYDYKHIKVSVVGGKLKENKRVDTEPWKMQRKMQSG